MLVTSNRSVGEWGSAFGDPVVATTILGRLLHHSQVITIRGCSYRLREMRRAGLVNVKPSPRSRARDPGMSRSAHRPSTSPHRNRSGVQFLVSPAAQFRMSLDTADGTPRPLRKRARCWYSALRTGPTVYLSHP